MKKILLVLFAFVLLNSGNSQNVIPGGKETIKIKGFISATAFMQDQSFKFGNGQNAEWVNSSYAEGKWINGFDIRNTRMTFIFNGPDLIKKWKMGGAMEFDFFGGYNGSSTFSAQQPMLRLRLAYMDFVHDNLRIRLGQAWTPMFGNVPVSLSHIAFPLGYGSAGFIGWRFPGVYSYYNLNDKDSPIQMSVDAALFNDSWNGTGATNFESAGNLGLPQFEMKFNVKAKNWSIYLVGHYDKKDFGSIDSKEHDYLDGIAGEVGAKIKLNKFLIQGNGYTGKNIGQQFGAMTQLQNEAKDLSSYGAWVQAGYELTQNWSVYAFYGFENVDKDQAKELFESPRTEHYLMIYMLKYSIGPTSLSIEYLNSKLIYGSLDEERKGNQISFSGMYKF